MSLFYKKDSKLIPIKSKEFTKESDLQKITENNLDVVFNLEFIKTENEVKGLFFDTLAYDREKNSFVIIEYKKKESFSVIDQGYAYLSLMLENRKEILFEFNKKMKKEYDVKDIDWSQSRVIFVSPSFTQHQIQAINFKDIPIQLWQVDQFGDDIIFYQPITPTSSSASIKSLSGSASMKRVDETVKVTTLEDHLHGATEKIKELFEELTVGVQEIDPGFTVHPVKTYIGYSKGGFNIAEVYIRRNKMNFHLLRIQPQDVKDLEKRLTYVQGSLEGWNKHVSKMEINSSSDVVYALMILKQVYDITKSQVSAW